MDVSASMADSLDTIFLQTETILIGINPMRLSAPWDYYLDSISLNPVKK